MKSKLAMIAVAGLLLTQFSVPGSYNLGVPRTPGTRVPENNPGTAIVSPSNPAPTAPAAPAPAGNTAPPRIAGRPIPLARPRRPSSRLANNSREIGASDRIRGLLIAKQPDGSLRELLLGHPAGLCTPSRGATGGDPLIAQD